MQKYEREIEELLERLEQEERHSPRPVRRDHPPQLPRRRPPVTPPLRRFTGFNLSPGFFMTTGLGLVILSWIIPIRGLQQWLAIAGVILFLWPIVSGVFSRRSAGTRSEKTWRGRNIEPDERSWSEIREHMGNAARDFRRRFRRRY